MGLAEDLVAAVQGAAGVDAGRKEVVTAFLQAAAPVIDGLGEEAFRALMGAVAGGEAAPEEVVGALDEDEVVAMVNAAEQQMAGLASARAAQAAASRAAIGQLAAAALMAVARAAVGAI